MNDPETLNTQEDREKGSTGNIKAIAWLVVFVVLVGFLMGAVATLVWNSFS